MLNRYSQLPKSTIINTQVLPDLGIIDKSLQRQQRNYDATAAATHKFQNDLAQQTAFGEYDNQVLSKFNEDAQNFVGSIADKDLGSPEIRNQFAGYVQSVASNPELKRIETAKALRANFEKGYQDLSAKGKVHDNQIKLHEMQWQKYSQTGDPKDLPTEPLYEAQDLIKGRGDLVSMLKANGTDIIQYLSDGTAYKNSSKGIASDRILKAVEDQLPTYLNSAYGKQEMNDFKAGIATGAIPKGTSFGQYITSQVLSTAQNYAYSDFSTNKDGALNRKADKEETSKTIPMESIGFGQEAYKGLRFNSDGSVKANNMWSKAFGTSFDGAAWADTEDEETNNNPVVAELNRIAKLNKITPKEAAEKLSQYTTIPFEGYVAGQGKKINEILPGISTSAKVINGSTVTTLNDMIQAKVGTKLDGLDAKQRKEAFSDIQVVGEVKPDGKTVTGYVIGGTWGQATIDLTDQVIAQAQSTNDSKEHQKAYNLLLKDAAAKVKSGVSAITMDIPEAGKSPRFLRWTPDLNTGEIIEEEVKIDPRTQEVKVVRVL